VAKKIENARKKRRNPHYLKETGERENNTEKKGGKGEIDHFYVSRRGKRWRGMRGKGGN